MAKKALIEKQQKKPTFKVRAYTPLGVPQVRALPRVHPRDGACR
jgi:hypothetical protein